ncbi:MAG: hypothetical protein OXD39_12435, partial [Gemmatimonadetes bacterium]|nr:hypothetical protein [Gemmatimonadota bacterium]
AGPGPSALGITFNRQAGVREGIASPGASFSMLVLIRNTGSPPYVVSVFMHRSACVTFNPAHTFGVP